MNKTQLIAGLRAHLADKEDIANEAAPALALMRYAVVELEKPTSGTQVNEVEVASLRKDLSSADSTITRLTDDLKDREGLLYSLLAEFGMVPEVDDEPVDSLREAIEQQPNILDALQDKISIINASQVEEFADDKDRFIAAVRRLLDGYDLPLKDLWGSLEGKAKYLEGLEKGIEERDQQIHRNDVFLAKLCVMAEIEADNVDYLQERLAQWSAYRNRLVAIRQKLGITATADLVNRLLPQEEEQVIELLIQQRDAARERLAKGREEAPAEDTLEAILEEVITIMRLDWEDVETVPHHVRKYMQYADDKRDAIASGAPKASWVSDAIDLAHAVRGNLAPENRVMAKAAEAIILSAPGRS